MQQLPFLLFVFTALTVSHAGVLIFVRRHPQMSESARRHLWLTHLWVHGVLWGLLILWILAMQFSLPRTLDVSALMKLIGISLLAGGTIMVLVVSLLLDFENLMGLRLFYPTRVKRVRSSLYRVFNNPMYDGFLLILLGAGLWFGIIQDFYLAVASFFLINVFLASVENYEFTWNPL